MDRNEKKNTFKNVQDKRIGGLQKTQKKSRIIGKVLGFIVLVLIIAILAFLNLKQFHEKQDLQLRIDMLSAEDQQNEQPQDNMTKTAETESETKTTEEETKATESKVVESETKSTETETQITESETAANEETTETQKDELQKIVENSQIKSALKGIGKNDGIEAGNIEDTGNEMQVDDLAKMYLIAMVYDGLNRTENPIQIEWNEEEKMRAEDTNNIERSYLQAMLNRVTTEKLSSDVAADTFITKFKEQNYTTDQFCKAAHLEKTTFTQFTEKSDAKTSVSDCISFMKQIADGKIANFAENTALGDGDPFAKMKNLFMEEVSDNIYPAEITALKNENPIWCSEKFKDQDKGECRRTIFLIQQGSDGYIGYFEYKIEQSEEAGKLSNEIWNYMNSLTAEETA